MGDFLLIFPNLPDRTTNEMPSSHDRNSSPGKTEGVPSGRKANEFAAMVRDWRGNAWGAVSTVHCRHRGAGAICNLYQHNIPRSGNAANSVCNPAPPRPTSFIL